jgi:hypothetical protein
MFANRPTPLRTAVKGGNDDLAQTNTKQRKLN